MSVRRPGVVKFIGVVLYVKAAIALVVGIALLVERNSSAMLEATGRDGDYILVAAIAEFVAALVLFAVASSILSGVKWARLVTAVVVGLEMAVSVYWMITHVGGGLQWNALMTVGIGIFVLWALYANDQSEAYFESHS
jgi:hypothetical protein